MRKTFPLAFLLWWSQSAWATSAVVFFQDNSLILAADGQATAVDGQHEPVCKTLKTGEFFWTIAGALPPGFSPQAIAHRTLGSGSISHAQRIDAFTSEVEAELSRGFRPEALRGPTVLQAIVTWFEGSRPNGRLIQFQWDGTRVRSMPAEVFSTPPGGIAMSAIGYHSFIDSYLEKATTVPPRITWQFAASLIQQEIDQNGGHTGGNISAVVIEGPAPGRGFYGAAGNCSSPE